MLGILRYWRTLRSLRAVRDHLTTARYVLVATLSGLRHASLACVAAVGTFCVTRLRCMSGGITACGHSGLQVPSRLTCIRPSEMRKRIHALSWEFTTDPAGTAGVAHARGDALLSCKQQTANSKQQTARGGGASAHPLRNAAANHVAAPNSSNRDLVFIKIHARNRRFDLSHCSSDASVTACALQRRTPPAAPSTMRNSAFPARVCTASRTRHRTEICPDHHAPRLLAGDAPRSRPRRMPPLLGGRHVEAWRAAAPLDLS